MPNELARRGDKKIRNAPEPGGQPSPESVQPKEQPLTIVNNKAENRHCQVGLLGGWTKLSGVSGEEVGLWV